MPQAWLAVTDEQKADVDALNGSSQAVRVNCVRSTPGAWLTSAAALPAAVPGGYLEHFATWYASLSLTDDVPAPRPPRPRR